MPLRTAMDRVPLPAVLIAVLVLLWGGFFNGVTNAYGIVACLAASAMAVRSRKDARGIPLAGLVLTALAATYLASSLASGLSLTTLSETGTWAAVAATALLASRYDGEGHAQCLRALTWFGVATAFAGFLTRAGVLPIYNGMDGTRLQFTFQYANGAGAWYGIVTLLCFLSPDKALRCLVPISAAAMLHTQSAGSLLAFVLVAVAVGAMWARAGAWGELLAALAHGVLGLALFAALRFAPLPVAAGTVALAVVLCTVGHAQVERVLARCDARLCSLAALAVLVVGGVAAVMLLRERSADAVASFAERACQIRDGLSLWARQPLLGIGPDNWQYRYYEAQTAPYRTTVVHSSYVQVLLDVGIVGFALLSVALVVGVRSLVKAQHEGWRGARMASVFFLLLHMLVDFDLSFGALACSLALLLFDGEGPRVGKREAVATVGCLALCLACACAGLYCDLQTKTLDDARAAGDAAAYRATYERSALAQRDGYATDGCVMALYAQGSYDETLALVQRFVEPSDQAALYGALCCYESGDFARGGLMLIQQMERRPYDEALYRSAKVIIDERGLESSLVERYNAAVDRANALMAQSAGLPVGWQPLDTHV